MEQIKEKIKIRPLREDEFQKVFELCEMRFGGGYLTREEFEYWLHYPELCLAVEYEGVFGGFVCHLPETVENVAAYMQLTPEYIREVSKGKPVIHCKTAILSPRYERKGLMPMLVKTVNDNSEKMGFGAAFAPAWKYHDHIPMEKTLIRLGFEKIAERENLWYNMDNYSCVVCGGKCRCSAVIFQKIF